MTALISWLRSKADIGQVEYSRFGLPGDETDDRPPPTHLHVAEFQENAPKFRVGNVHAQRSALITAGIGIGSTIFVFFSAFLEFDWYHNKRGVDVLALVGLICFLFFGILVHYYVIVGIRKAQPYYLLPFLVVYGVAISAYLLALITIIFNWTAIANYGFASPSTRSMIQHTNSETGETFTVDVDHHSDWSSGTVHAFITLFLMLILLCLTVMMRTVLVCHNFLVAKRLHEIEMAAAERAKLYVPGLTVLMVRKTGDGASLVTVEQGKPDAVVVAVEEQRQNAENTAREMTGNGRQQQQLATQS